MQQRQQDRAARRLAAQKAALQGEGNAPAAEGGAAGGEQDAPSEPER